VKEKKKNEDRKNPIKLGNYQKKDQGNIATLFSFYSLILKNVKHFKFSYIIQGQ